MIILKKWLNICIGPRYASRNFELYGEKAENFVVQLNFRCTQYTIEYYWGLDGSGQAKQWKNSLLISFEVVVFYGAALNTEHYFVLFVLMCNKILYNKRFFPLSAKTWSPFTFIVFYSYCFFLNFKQVQIRLNINYYCFSISF